MHQDVRKQVLERWLAVQFPEQPYTLKPASSDASFRRYFRLQVNDQSLIVMDAPPDKENCRPFVEISRTLVSSGVNAPQVLQQDLQEGILILDDLGDQQYLARLQEQNADHLYRDAIQTLLRMQHIKAPLRFYDEELLRSEMRLFEQWYIGRHLGHTLSRQQTDALEDIYQLLVDNALEQPQVFVHRDYHSRNLMITGTNNPGVLDFQDAVIGPVSYDLVSLLKDCYIAWPRAYLETWIDYYLDKAWKQGILDTLINRDLFIRWFDLIGVQRHLKVLGIFARLYHRDDKPGYLNDLPRVLAYVKDACQRHQELAPLEEILQSLMASSNELSPS